MTSLYITKELKFSIIFVQSTRRARNISSSMSAKYTHAWVTLPSCNWHQLLAGQKQFWRENWQADRSGLNATWLTWMAYLGVTFHHVYYCVTTNSFYTNYLYETANCHGCLYTCGHGYWQSGRNVGQVFIYFIYSIHNKIIELTKSHCNT